MASSFGGGVPRRAAPDIVSAAACWCARNHFCRGGIVHTRFVSTPCCVTNRGTHTARFHQGKDLAWKAERKRSASGVHSSENASQLYRSASHRRSPYGSCGPKGSQKRLLQVFAQLIVLYFESDVFEQIQESSVASV